MKIDAGATQLSQKVRMQVNEDMIRATDYIDTLASTAQRPLTSAINHAAELMFFSNTACVLSVGCFIPHKLHAMKCSILKAGRTYFSSSSVFFLDHFYFNPSQ
jgi:hypothetical protein